eukprot:Awhi_evm1s9860
MIETENIADYRSQAELFNRQIEVFIKDALGYDLQTQESTLDGGLFGHLSGLYGVCETQ